MAEQKWHNIKCNIFPIKNDFFGHTVTVAGLVTGGDLINQLKDKNLGEKLLIPSTMLRYEQDVFLDNITISEVEKELNIKVEIVPVDGREFLKSLLNIK